MNMRYTDWEETALTLHLVAQMLGKVKLARMEPQPEWNQVVLEVTAEGFSTGLIPNGDKSFSIAIRLREGKVEVNTVDGTSSDFAFGNGIAVSDYYNEFNRMLADVDCETDISSVPAEMGTSVPFERQTEKRNFNNQQAAAFFEMCVFARNRLLRFVSPFRGKKMLPSFFWGTFDVSTVLFSGKPAPFQGEGVIERVAFDEQMIEFGFWPGDDKMPDPSFFALPYPFLSVEPDNTALKPDQAMYNKDKAEYFLALRDVLATHDPGQALNAFFRSAYDIVTRAEKWDRLEWFNQPLLVEKPGRGWR